MLGQLATAIGGGVVGTGGSNNSSSGSGAGGPVEFEDESDGEDGGDGADNLADQELKGATAVAELDGVDRMAPSILAHAKTFGSLIGWVRTVEWKHTRNKNECLALAQAVDLLLAEGVPVSSMGNELLLRRLNGVHLADSFNNWGVCTALQWTGPNNSLLPRAALTSALKQAAQMEKLTARTTKSTFGQKSNYGQQGRYGGNKVKIGLVTTTTSPITTISLIQLPAPPHQEVLTSNEQLSSRGRNLSIANY